MLRVSYKALLLVLFISQGQGKHSDHSDNVVADGRIWWRNNFPTFGVFQPICWLCRGTKCLD